MRIFLISFLAFVLSFTVAGAQSVDALKRQIKQAEETIKKNNAQLQANKNKQKNSQEHLKIVKSTIDSRKKIIDNLSKQEVIIRDSVRRNNGRIGSLNTSLGSLKKSYAASLRSSYKSYKAVNPYMFILSAGDLQQIVLRLYYLRRFSGAGVGKAEEIKSTTTVLSDNVERFKRLKKELETTISNKNREVAKLSAEEKEYNNSISKLKREESSLTKNINNQRKRISSISAQLSKLVEEEARRERDRASKRSTKENAAVAKLSDAFAANKGRLQMPVSGTITDHFGVHAHPTQPNLKVNNKGINIITSSRSAVKSIHKGTISKVLSLSGVGNCVMVRHGGYIAVYSNLSTVGVSQGRNIDTGDIIGYIEHEGEKAMLHFELWKETTPVNPEAWCK